jgi:hypothetical protein
MSDARTKPREIFIQTSSCVEKKHPAFGRKAAGLTGQPRACSSGLHPFLIRSSQRSPEACGNIRFSNEKVMCTRSSKKRALSKCNLQKKGDPRSPFFTYTAFTPH